MREDEKRQFRSRTDLRLLIDRLQSLLDGPEADAERGNNLGVRLPGGHHPSDLEFSAREFHAASV